jgi:hypothetical protein
MQASDTSVRNTLIGKEDSVGHNRRQEEGKELYGLITEPVAGLAKQAIQDPADAESSRNSKREAQNNGCDMQAGCRIHFESPGSKRRRLVVSGVSRFWMR